MIGLSMEVTTWHEYEIGSEWVWEETFRIGGLENEAELDSEEELWIE